MTDMYVCLCADMTEFEIREAIKKDSIDSFEDLTYSTNVCSGCQTCMEKVTEIFNDEITLKIDY